MQCPAFHGWIEGALSQRDLLQMSPLGWEGPVWLWSGPEAEAPPCPTDVPDLVFEGHAGLQARGDCGTCACTQPECKLPSGVGITQTDCSGTFIEVLPPLDWDGSCLPIPSVKKATGVDFWGSSRSECLPVLPTPEKSSSISWDIFARACARPAAPASISCSTEIERCSPEGGFQLCVFSEVEATHCPSAYPEMHRFYRGIVDGTSCSPCHCAAPERSDCGVFVALSSDSACHERILGTTVGHDDGACQMIPSPRDFRGIVAEVRSSEPGQCTPLGGELIGDVVPAEPTTFCCR
ncbi:uncharacterized protein CMC5_057220 [Chondromyces crocatus]|uniref:Uncharacterized protein n=1 Tax=Chondromyces crocatus TaxID=52 RepID=A0A0K1EKW4_CHOCO|nr:uncharacterized protein CMC5_057220 [Chondromyces crocatus]